MKGFVRILLLMSDLSALVQISTAQKKSAAIIPSPKKPIRITSALDSVVVQAGSTTSTLLPSRAVYIKAAAGAMVQ